MVDLTKLSNLEILTLTVIGEARGEPIEGQVAVANVIHHRLTGNPIKYKSIHDVVLQPLQFSCWNKSDPNRKVLEEMAEKILLGENVFKDVYMRQCEVVARAVFDGDFADNVHLAQHYMTKELFYSGHKPSWAKHPKRVMERGNQVFLVL